MSSKKLLTIELIPKTCHFSNARTMVSTKNWDKIRFMSYEKAKNKCELCKDIGKNQGYKHNLECHEIWHYDDVNKIQTLLGLISLCPICHKTKHYGRAKAMGYDVICQNQMMKVNKWTIEQVNQHIQDSFKEYIERSKFKWTLDLSVLTKEPYNIKISPNKKRVYAKNTYKKKKKKKTLVRKRKTN